MNINGLNVTQRELATMREYAKAGKLLEELGGGDVSRIYASEALAAARAVTQGWTVGEFAEAHQVTALKTLLDSAADNLGGLQVIENPIARLENYSLAGIASRKLDLTTVSALRAPRDMVDAVRALGSESAAFKALSERLASEARELTALQSVFKN